MCNKIPSNTRGQQSGCGAATVNVDQAAILLEVALLEVALLEVALLEVALLEVALLEVALLEVAFFLKDKDLVVVQPQSTLTNDQAICGNLSPGNWTSLSPHTLTSPSTCIQDLFLTIK